ncbi:uncharacterized protein LOC100184301 isoform X2 [Ciona intestinalis]
MMQATKQQYDEVIFDDVTMTYSDVTKEAHKPQILRKRSRLKALLMLCRIFLIIQVSQLFSLASGDYYQGYLTHIIRNQTSSACETSVPGYLFIRCPQMTTISIQGAMYGRKVPSTMMCPVYSSILSPAALIGIKENTNCEAETSLAKTVTVCQDKRVCQLLVHPREFGKDPCPDTSKYLTVTYKCRLSKKETESFRKRGSCRDANVRLRCPRGAASTPNVIAVYNVTITDNPSCGNVTQRSCNFTKATAMDYVTKRCHGQYRCTFPVSRDLCGNFLHVEYSCVPVTVLTRRLPTPSLAVLPVSEETNDVSTTTVTLNVTSQPITSSTPRTTTKLPIIPKLTRITQPTTVTTKQVLTTSVIQTSPQPTSSVALTTHDVTTVTTTRNSGRDLDRDVIKPTSSIRESSVEAVNEFPLPGIGKKGVTPTEILVLDSGAAASELPMSTPGNSTGGNASAVTSSGFMFIRSMAALVIFIRENSDRVLIVFLASISIGLFLTVCVLLYKREDFPSFRKKKKKKEVHNEDSASLLGNRETSRQSQADSSSTGGGNAQSALTSNSGSNRRANHIDYINHVTASSRKRKQRSRIQALLVKCCSCCCTNAPWQRDGSTADDDYHIARQSTSLSDDDVISAVASGRNHFDGEPAPIFAPSPQHESTPTSDNHYQAFSGGSDGMRYVDDNTSEYEYQDDITPPTPAPIRPTTLRTNPNVAPIIPNGHRPYNTGYRSPNQYDPHTQSRQFTQSNHIREPPPFPKTSNYNYHHVAPHYATHRIAYNNTFQPNNTNSMHHIAQHAPQHHSVAYPTSFGDHYVSLQPQLRQPSNARTLTLGHTDPRLERRDSFYDNSLPRDSPLYEYYQRQNRQELPGTRNINHYYS